MKTIKTLINEIKTSETLQKLLAEAVKNSALAAFLKEQGCEATPEEFIAAVKAPSGALDDDALDTVAGGANVDEVITSIFSFGIGCVVETIISAKGSGVGDGPDGRILCNDEDEDNDYNKPIIV